MKCSQGHLQFVETSLGHGLVPIFGEISADHLSALFNAPADAGVVICSDGGDVDVARALVDVVRVTRRTTYAVGICASAALLIFAAGETRKAGPLTRFLHHEPYTDAAVGRQKDIELYTQDMQAWTLWANTFLARRTARTLAWWRNFGHAQGGYLTASEALEIGLVHSLLNKKALKAT